MKYHSEQLRKHCRICGGRLNKAKKKKTQSVLSCQDHSVDLQTFAGVCTDPSQLQSTATYSTFCNPCFFNLRRVKMACKRVSFSSQWLPWNGLLIHTCIHTYIIHTYIHTCMHAYIHTYIHTYK